MLPLFYGDGRDAENGQNWIKRFFTNSGRAEENTTRHSGVYVTPSVRTRESQQVSSSGHKWGSGNRLGSD